MADQDKLFTPFPKGFGMPFFYDAVSFIWTYYRVPADCLTKHLEGTGLTASTFPDLDNDAIVSLNFQNYLSNLGMVLTTVLEIEFNIHGYPTSKKHEAPTDIPFRDYLQGQEQTKWIGGFRLHVPANDPIAVKAGTLVFGERKFMADFDFNIPVPNNPPKPGTAWPWDYSVYQHLAQKDGETDDQYATRQDKSKKERLIYNQRANLDALGRPVLTNPSPLTLYSLLPGGANEPPGYGRLNASRWNILGLDKTWFDLDKHPGTVQLDVGDGGVHEMARDMKEILLDTKAKACALRYFQSPPAAIENRAFWVDEQ